MAAPTKEQREQRKKIEAIIKRDADYYISVERAGKAYSKKYGHRCFAPYALVDAIIFREWDDRTLLLRKISKCIIPPNFVDDRSLLFRVDYLPLFGIYHNKEELIDWRQNYKVNYVYPDFKKEKTTEHLTEKGYLNEDGSLIESQNNLPILTMIEKLGTTNKSALVHIDFTKPLDEIVSIVTKIKNDFDKDHGVIQTLGEFLGIEKKKEVYKCDLENCDIYTEKNPKPIEGRLIDALFIYDCKIFGLTNEYALNEINRYWNDVQNLFTEKMQDNTRIKYLEFMTDLIDNRKYTSFMTGIKTT